SIESMLCVEFCTLQLCGGTVAGYAYRWFSHNRIYCKCKIDGTKPKVILYLVLVIYLRVDFLLPRFWICGCVCKRTHRRRLHHNNMPVPVSNIILGARPRVRVCKGSLK